MIIIKELTKSKDLLVLIFQIILNSSLTLLAFILAYLMIMEIKDIVVFIALEKDASFKEFLEKILVFFLYFEFIALIVKYFKEHYHFPLRYFMYIGITAMLRVIIIDHDNANDTLLFSLTILVLVIGYIIIKAIPRITDN
ncbi:MAG TPA: phosphate-starvation-inducible protein PsiE [Bacillus bacterium]|nr:phosphate-starvation-inducible protein PsiE [Bacillus sp. (in: firmicutes)]